MMLLVVLAVVMALGLVLELVRPFVGDFLARLHREDAIRGTVRQAQADAAEAKKRADALAGAARAIRQEVARAKEAQANLEQELENRKKVEPVLVFSIGAGDDPTDSSRHCFRATITKKLRPEPEPNQRQIWSRRCFVEVCCYSAAEAKLEAHLQFPAAQGYGVGPFAEHRGEASDTQLTATGEAA